MTINPLNLNTAQILTLPDGEIIKIIKLSQAELTGSDKKIGGKFREFMQEMRQNGAQYHLKLRTVKALFKDSTVWKNNGQHGGHASYTHVLTRVRVEFQDHDGPDVDCGAAVTIREQVQKHINTLYHKILGYSVRNEPAEPNWKLAVINYRSLHTDSPVIRLRDWKAVNQKKGFKQKQLTPKDLGVTSSAKKRKSNKGAQAA